MNEADGGGDGPAVGVVNSRSVRKGMQSDEVDQQSVLPEFQGLAGRARFVVRSGLERLSDGGTGYIPLATTWGAVWSQEIPFHRAERSSITGSSTKGCAKG